MSTNNTKGLVALVGDFMVKATSAMFMDRGYDIVKINENPDYIAWLGGIDISPELYHEAPIPGTSYSSAKDRGEVAHFNEHVGRAKLLGICRGAQLLNVLNGGKMWQNIDGHNGGGFHTVYDSDVNKTHKINTLHHQQMIPNLKTGKLVAYAFESTFKEKWKFRYNHDKVPSKHESYFNRPIKPNGTEVDPIDPEVIFYPNTQALCFQAHPEFGHKPTTDYFFELMERYYGCAA